MTMCCSIPNVCSSRRRIAKLLPPPLFAWTSNFDRMSASTSNRDVAAQHGMLVAPGHVAAFRLGARFFRAGAAAANGSSTCR